MSENSPQGSFLRTLPYGSREPAHIHPPSVAPRGERTHADGLAALAVIVHLCVSRAPRVGDFFA